MNQSPIRDIQPYIEISNTKEELAEIKIILIEI